MEPLSDCGWCWTAPCAFPTHTDLNEKQPWYLDMTLDAAHTNQQCSAWNDIVQLHAGITFHCCFPVCLHKHIGDIDSINWCMYVLLELTRMYLFQVALYNTDQEGSDSPRSSLNNSLSDQSLASVNLNSVGSVHSYTPVRTRINLQSGSFLQLRGSFRSLYGYAPLKNYLNAMWVN